ncbi:MAG: single-stranded-DNA-specific exonuclease RecJ [Lachnospiraceae bacterium]|nr:single-stranded-DNA-specific exonuclease RecJ [Lachnospiraceae bacterium]
MNKKWVVSAKWADFKGIGQRYGIDQVVARIIRNRDVVEEEEIRQYLMGGRNDFYSPYLLKDMEKAISILMEKIQSKKKIRIIGDYDIDGVCSTYILYTGLIRCGAWADFEIPDRIKDGYGVNEQLIEAAYEAGIDTIVTCDNGIAASRELQKAKDYGMTVIVTDHHEVPYTEEEGQRTYILPPADAIINHKQADCLYPFKELCGGAVAFKVITALYEKYQIPPEELNELLGFAGFATVGDVMELKKENRILVKEGLKELKNTSNIGLLSLMKACGIDKDKLSAYHIGFVLGPCLNASGRLDTAKKALELLSTKDFAKAALLANELKLLNESRKELTDKGVKEAIAQVEQSDLSEDRVLVIYLPDCHESIAGIIAGRIREKYYKPVFVLTKAEDGVKGSGRSIESYSMYDEMTKIKPIFTKYGGHPMAAGLSLKEEDVDNFRQQINQVCTLTEEDLIEKIVIDVPMPIDYISEQVILQLEVLEPFGKGNEKPVFADKNLKILRAYRMGKQKNMLRLYLENDRKAGMEAVLFRGCEEFELYLAEKFGEGELEKIFRGEENDIRIAVTYYPSINTFQGQQNLQITILGWQ